MVREPPVYLPVPRYRSIGQFDSIWYSKFLLLARLRFTIRIQRRHLWGGRAGCAFAPITFKTVQIGPAKLRAIIYTIITIKL